MRIESPGGRSIHDPTVFRHRRHPWHRGAGAHHARLRAAPGPCGRARAAARPARRHGADRQGHAHLGLHAGKRARIGLQFGRRGRGAARPGADAGGGLPDTRPARRAGGGDQRQPQRLPRQRHQVLQRPRHQAARRLGARGRGHAGRAAAVGDRRRPGPRAPAGRRGWPLHRVLQEQLQQRAEPARAEGRGRRRPWRGLPDRAQGVP